MTMDRTIPFDPRHMREFSDVDSRSMVVSGDEARLYRAIWRAFPDSPWFLIKTLRDNRYVPHNPDCPMLYSIRPMRGKMPEEFAAVFEKGLHEPELYEWDDVDAGGSYSINAEELESMIRAFEGRADSHGHGTVMAV